MVMFGALSRSGSWLGRTKRSALQAFAVYYLKVTEFHADANGLGTTGVALPIERNGDMV